MIEFSFIYRDNQSGWLTLRDFESTQTKAYILIGVQKETEKENLQNVANKQSKSLRETKIPGRKGAEEKRVKSHF